MFDWLYHWLGLGSANGSQYLFWSGFGSDITEFAIVIAIIRGALKLRRHHDKRADALHRHIDYKFNQLNKEGESNESV